MDKIIIKDARFLCNIGTTSKERIKKQEIFIDVELFLKTKKRAKLVFLSDNIKNTINYSNVYNLLKEIVEKNKYNLIETMAENISKRILSKFSIKKVLVRVKKPDALANKNIKYVAVEIVREKNG